MQIEQKYLDEIKMICKKYCPNAQIYLFGSRAQNTAIETSDVDVVIKNSEAIPLSNLAKIKFDIEESNIPYLIDIVDWERISDDFKSAIENTKILI